jgi:hypothetical protein
MVCVREAWRREGLNPWEQENSQPEQSPKNGTNPRRQCAALYGVSLLILPSHGKYAQLQSTLLFVQGNGLSGIGKPRA